jgi:hypothetical protein
MKKSLLTTTMIALLSFSTSSLALGDLSERDANRIKSEVDEMTKVLNLNEQKSSDILTLKVELNKATNKLLEKHGSRNAEWRAEREPYWQAYRKGLLSVITEKQLKEYNQKKSL